MGLNVTTYSQIKDANGALSSTQAGRLVAINNQCFTLTSGTIATGTVPLISTSSCAVVITVSANSDVFFLPAAAPTLVAPNGTVTAVNYQLINNQFITTMKPGQAFQLLYNNTPVTGNTVTVHLAYYELASNSFAG